MTRKKSSLQLFPSCHDFKSIRVPPDFLKKYKIQSSCISLITCSLCFETRYSCAWANDRGLWERDYLGPSHKEGSKYTETNKIITEAICLRSAGYVLFCSCVASFHILSRMGTQDNNCLYLFLNFLSFRQDIGQISTWKVDVKNKYIKKIWPYKKAETCVQTPPPLRRCYGRRLWKLVWILACASSFWPLFSRKQG